MSKQSPKANRKKNARAKYSRRTVLGGSSALAAAAVLGPRSRADQSAVFRPGPRLGKDVYVQLFLRGAMDGLSLLVPHGDDDYYAARPTLAVPKPGQPDGALDLDGFFGLAPAAAPLLTPYGNGHLLLAHATGSTDPTRSHFDAFARMEFGDPNLPPGSVQNAWLARYLNQSATSSQGVLRAVAISDVPPLSLLGAPRSLPIPDPGNFLFPGNPATALTRSALIGSMYADEPPPVGSSVTDTLNSIDLLAQIDFANYTPSNGALYPPTELGQQLCKAAALIKADRGIEAITIDYGGWDHHADQGPLDGLMATMMDELARSLEAFYLDMLPILDRVSLVCLSEFGRRVAENSSLGTDHGHGGAFLALGGGIQGGRVLANWPGLAPAQLDNGDLAVTIDFRDLLGELLERRLAATNLTQIFPQHTFTSYGITV